jgi:hypothetical protein
MILDESITESTRGGSERLNARCACASHRTGAASDPAQRISTHRTSGSHVVYYRCYCGRPGVALVRLGHHR